MDVRIGEVVTEVVVSDTVGPLGPDEVRRLVTLVLEQVRHETARRDQQARDADIHDRVFRPEV